MANSVKIKFGFGQQTAVQFSHQDCLIFKIRACQKFTERTYDAASATRKNSIRLFSERCCIVLWEIAAMVELVATQHKAAALSGNMLHGGRPCRAMVGRWRAINLNSLGIHVGA